MKLSIKIETWPIQGHFTISRASLTQVELVTVEISDGEHIGRGECRPYARYGETSQSVSAQIETCRKPVEIGLDTAALSKLLPAGAARNALDCALWDLRCKGENTSIWSILGRAAPPPKPTAITLSVDMPEAMAEKAAAVSEFNILKLKVDAQRIGEQISAVAAARPDARFIVDANEALAPEDVYALSGHPNAAQIAMIEQPLHDDIIGRYDFSAYDGPPLCADESFHEQDQLIRLKSLGYKAVNIKLDKCGGFSSAFNLAQTAKAQGFQVMGGCMLSTSLAIAPMAAIMDMFDIIDLDGGALLAKDRHYGLKYEAGYVHPPTAKLWG